MKEVTIKSKIVGRGGASAATSPGKGVSVDMSGYLLKQIWEKVFEFRLTDDGTEYLFAKMDLAVQGGVTMYANGGNLNLKGIYDGLPIDNDTIYWDGTVLKSRGVGEGGATPTLLGDLKNVGAWANAIATEDRIMVQKKDSSSWEALELSKIGGSASFENVKESGAGNAYTSFVLSEDKKSLTFLKAKVFAEKSNSLSGYGIADAYTKTNVDSLLSAKWTKDDEKIANWDAAFGWGDHSKAGYMKKSVIYDESLGCWKLDGDLLVTGGITMFANEGKYTPSTITDAVIIDGNTLVRVNGVIMLNPDIEFGGGVADSVAWSDVTGKPTWIGNNKPSYTTSEVTEGTNLYFTNARAVSALSSSLSNYLPLTGGIMTGTIQSQTIRPKASDSYSLGTSSYLWSNVYTKLATIDGIEIKKSASGVLFIDGNLVVSGGITMYGTDGTSAPSIWDGAPKATTTNNENGKGIASFDSKYFSVTNGHVTFIGSTGGGGGKNLNITLPDGSTKVEYNGDAEKSIVLTRLYKSTEVTTATTDEGTITPLAMNTWTTGKFPLKNGTGATGEWNISIKGNAATATKATQDGNGNNIASTYLTKSVASTTYLGINAKAASATSADSATNATNASKVYLTGSSSNSTYRLVFADGASGSNRSLYVDNENTATAGYNPSTNTFVGNGVTLGNGVYASIKNKGWYRFATTINAENVAGGSLIFSIRRQYNNYKTESHIIAVSVGYSSVTFTQIAGAPSDALITKVRATNNTNGVIYFDFYYGVDTTNTHNVYVNCIGSASLQTPTSTTQLLSYVTEFDLVNGFKSNVIHFTSLNNLGYLRSKCGKNLLVGGDNLSGGTTYAFARYSYSDAVKVNRTYRLTICGKLGENTSHIYAYWDGGSGNNTYIGGLSKTEERIITVRAKITNKGTNKQLVFFKFNSSNTQETTSYCYIRWAYLEEEFQEGELSTTTDYNTWLTEYNNRDTKTFLHKIQRLNVGESYWSADAGMKIDNENAYAVVMKRTNDNGGIFIRMFANNQTAKSWASGVNNAHQYSWWYQNGTSDTQKMYLDSSGNLLTTGGITMYSDLRKKTILNHVELSLKEVADAPLIEHYYNSDEKKTTHVGSVAQYWAGLNDWFCKEDGEGFLTMEIQNAALASAISVARELTRYESKTDKQIKKLKKRIGELEEEIENLKKV